jgi:hypothetical protein
MEVFMSRLTESERIQYNLLRSHTRYARLVLVNKLKKLQAESLARHDLDAG